MKFSSAEHPAFTLIDQKPLPIWNCHAFVYRHQSGAKVLSLCTEDDHKTFGIIFPTPPINHTGLPHILEHCVLCGSEKYPVKEPFKEMLKTSLQTFLNAFTYPDRTCYPVSSQNLQDFYHLMDVYLDAVFFPRLTPAVLGQEGWRLQWDEQKQLEFQGVVFNEMKGVYASPESRLDEMVRKELYPDTPYRFDYGGDPSHITDLSFEQFTQFHQDHYHPANAIAAFYGNDDPLVRLEKIHDVFEQAHKAELPSPIPIQAPWHSPKKVHAPYPTVEGSDEGAFVQLNWLLEGDATDAMNQQMASLAASLLLNSPASPLRIALLDSELGEDIIGGPTLYLQQPAFSAGLRGVEPGSEQDVFDCIMTCLQSVVKENFRPDLIEGLLNTTEFQMREMNSSNKGLAAILNAAQPWMYGGDPLEVLDPEPRMKLVRKNLKDNPRLFAEWVQKNLLENNARVESILTPDDSLEAEENQREKSKLAAIDAELAQNEVQRSEVIALAKAVEDFQKIPDATDATAKLPKLSIKDITPLPAPPPFAQKMIAGVPLSTTEVHSNRIAYLQLAFDIHHLNLEELALLPLYSRCLTELGTAKSDHLQFNEQVACHTGGINVQFETSATYHADQTVALMMIKTKCLESKLDPTLSLLSDMLCTPLLGPADKVHQLLLEERSNEESDLIQSGNQVVSLRLKSAFSSMERASEEMDGVGYLLRLREFEKLSPDLLKAKITALHEKLVNRQQLKMHVGGDAVTIENALNRVQIFLQSLPEAPPADSELWPLLEGHPQEGLVMASPIQFVGLGSRLDLSATGNHFSHFVAQRLINNDYLWEQVRMRGGAYGSSCSYSHLDGMLIFTSYRDPQLDQTLDIYRATGEWLQNLNLSSSDLEQAIIGTIGKMSPPERPASLVAKSFFRSLIGLTHETREQFWQEILETTPQHLHAYGKAISEALQKESRICILGGQKALSHSVRDLHLTPLM
ncbi:insulinase family protein [Kiritimatiellota bacterium B12222]|nr:insulinase family protein [Kiritimatiellota bacterium B12222]